MTTVIQFPQSDIHAAIFDFFRHRYPPLRPSVAAEVVRALSRVPYADLKSFALAIRKEFGARGYPLQHTHALNLAAKLNGFASWPQLANTLQPLTVWYPDGTNSGAKSWEAAVEQIKQRCLQHRSSSRELVLNSDRSGLTLCLRHHDGEVAPSEELIAAVNPAVPSERWWEGARGALEGLRRRLEEGRHFFIDGYLAARLCSREYQFSEPYHALHLPDAANSELLLMQQNHPDEAYEMTEIARGDELECFIQLERSLDAAPGSLLIEVVEQSWIVRGRRFRWALSTLRPLDFVPGLATLYFDEAEDVRLKHRYQLASEILRSPEPRRAARKPLPDIDSPREHYRVNQHAILLALNKQNMDWDLYCREFGEESLPTLEPTMPLWALLDFAQRVKLVDPNVMFARPTRAELVRADSSEVLRALYLRIDHVVFREPAGFSREQREQVSQIVQTFAESVRTYQLIRGGVMQLSPDDTAHLAWIDDARELFESSHAEGFSLYVGRVPRLFPIEDSKVLEGMTPFAFGHSLYLDFDYDQTQSRETA